MDAPIRDRGIGEHVNRGQANLFDELRARVCTWPPLRPARLRCERESVVVVQPMTPRVEMSNSPREGVLDSAIFSVGMIAFAFVNLVLPQTRAFLQAQRQGAVG